MVTCNLLLSQFWMFTVKEVLRMKVARFLGFRGEENGNSSNRPAVIPRS